MTFNSTVDNKNDKREKMGLAALQNLTININSSVGNVADSYKNVWNNCEISVSEEKRQILEWLSPLAPRERNCVMLEFAGAARHAYHIEPAPYPSDLHITHGHVHALSSNRLDKEVSDMRSGSVPPGVSSFMLLSMPRYRSTNLRICACDR